MGYLTGGFYRTGIFIAGLATAVAIKDLYRTCYTISLE